MVADTLGGLAVTVAISVYLGAVPPSTQVEVVNRDLLPALEERGVHLKWRSASALLELISKHVVDQQSFGEQSSGAEAEHLSSYYHLCLGVLPHLVAESLTDQWLAMGYTLPNLVALGMVTSSWNRWTLIHDRDGAAAAWIKQSRGEDLVLLDACDRSARFFLSLENAFLNGRPVLIENMTGELDPALQPLVELGHSWNQLPTGALVPFITLLKMDRYYNTPMCHYGDMSVK